MYADAARDAYRSRIYGSYCTKRSAPIAPDTVDGLRLREPYLRKLVRRHMPVSRDSQILDLGCGYGALLHALREFGYRNVRGVDGSPEQVAAAARLGIEGVEREDVLAFLRGTPDASLDVVVAFDLIEHFTKCELIPLVDEVLRVLKPGGRWIVHVPNGEGPFGSSMRFHDFTHELAFTRFSLDQLLRASGFARVDCHEDRPAPHGAKSLVRALLWAVIRGCLLGYVAVETGAFDRSAVFSLNLLAIAHKKGA